jgi:hypothetical protein
MKPPSPHDPFDDLIAAALHGDLSAEERTHFEARLQTDPAARAAYQEAQAMHDLLEKTNKSAQPNSDFEQRMISGVRRKLNAENQRETPWQSVLVLWSGLRGFFTRRLVWNVAGVCLIFAVLAGVALGPITSGIKQAKGSAAMEMARQRDFFQQQQPALAQQKDNYAKVAAASPPPSESPDSAPSSSPMSPEPTTTLQSKASNSVAVADSASIAPVPMPPGDRPVDEMKTLFSQDRTKLDANGITVASNGNKPSAPAEMDLNMKTRAAAAMASTTPAPDTRKLIRNAQLELEVKSFQDATDQIAALTKADGGYVDTSNSEKGGNGKLQGTVVVKILPQNLDSFLLKLRDLGEVKNQSVGTEDVTKEYVDTQARLENSQRMEAQLQDLLKHENSKVSDLLQVERELGRVRGEIEQMQGQLKLYDFQVQYATVTLQVREKDLHSAAAYLLKEQDDFSLYSTDVEGTFQKARQIADDFKGQILAANLNHDSGSDISAELQVTVAPDQVEAFLVQVRGLGRVANFTRQTQRVAQDGGDSDQPADQTLTEKDKVQVHLAIRSDDESRKQVALTVVTKAVDDALDQAKAAALAQPGVEVLSSSLNKSEQGQTEAKLSLRVPGKDYADLLAALRKLGRQAAFTVDRNDNAGPGASGDDAPVILSLSLTDDETPLQTTELSVLATDVEGGAQQIKQTAATSNVEVKTSSFERQPDGTETATLTFRLPLAQYPAFVESVKKLGKVESLTVHRDDRPDQTRADDGAPAEISLTLHNQGDIVADNGGLWATLRSTFGEGARALFASINRRAGRLHAALGVHGDSARLDRTAHLSLAQKLNRLRSPAGC